MGVLGFELRENGRGKFEAFGALDIYNFAQGKQIFASKIHGKQSLTIDLAELEKLDTAGSLLLQEIIKKHKINLENIKSEHAQLLEFVGKIEIATPDKPKPENIFIRAVSAIGKKFIHSTKSAAEFTEFLGQAIVTFLKSCRSLKHLRFADITHHIEEAGIKAIPIISVMAFMIAIVLTYQGVAQLKPLGVEHLTVNLVAISVLREMGVLITAIMIAGRSGSAFTAQIGVMKVREEVDALQVLGINPFEVLALPRMLALLVILPLLTFIADIMGLLGGGIMSMLLADISPETYISRVREVVSGNDFIVGMIKAPVFALLIAIVGCMHGMRVAGSAEIVGRETTAAVVKSIFLVIIADALFSILFEKLGI